MLPLLLWLSARGRSLPLLVVVGALAVRASIWVQTGEVWSLAYWTLVGRIDQFTLGIVAFHFSSHMKGRHRLAAALIVVVCAVFYVIDRTYDVSMAREAATWVGLATFEAVAYSMLIAWYDTSFKMRNVGVSGWIGLIGAYSYSIYLLHVFFFERVAGIIHRHVMPLSNIYAATAWAFVFLVGMAVVGHFSFRYIEAPFLKHRLRYVRPGINASSDAPGRGGLTVQ